MNIKIMAVVIAAVLTSFTNCGSSTPVSQTSSSSGGTASAAPLWTGNGGRGRSIAILAPQATGLAANQNFIPALVQGEFVSNFTSYSAIAVLDRQRLDEQYAELLSGYYSDDAQEGWDLGHLSPTDYIMGGNITRTNTGFAMQISITRSADKMTVASYSGTCTLDELSDLSGVRRASLDLLQRMGVTPTERARTELSGAAAANHVNAQTALARGIVSQHLGNTVETLVQFYQAAAFDPGLTEAAARANTMSASIRTGSMGANIRNDIAWRDEWVKILADANISLQNIPHPQRPALPEQIVVAQIFVPDSVFHQGMVDYNARTVELRVNFNINDILFPGPYPLEYIAAVDAYNAAFEARSDAHNRIVADLNAGLDATRRNEAWQLAALHPIPRDPPEIIPRSGEVTVIAVVELLNDAGRVIGNIGRAAELGRFSFGARGTALINRADIRQFAFTVRADDITDHMKLRITASAPPSQNNLVQVMAYSEMEALRPMFIPNGVTSISDFQFRERGLTFIDIPNSVTSIGNRAFSNNLLSRVTIPDSVTSIGDGAFEGNLLTSVTIPNKVTGIRRDAFAGNRLTSVTIPNSVTSIGWSAFENNRLTSVTIPNRVTHIGDGAFAGNRLASVTIPNRVTYIGSRAFQGNRLTSVVIPNRVTSIGSGAFAGNQLTSVTIPNSVTEIINGAFADNQLTSVTIPKSVRAIFVGAFVNNPLTSVTIGADVDLVGAFGTGFEVSYSRNRRSAGTYIYDSFRGWHLSRR